MTCAQCTAWKMAATETAEIVKQAYAIGDAQPGEKLLAMVRRLVRERDEARGAARQQGVSPEPSAEQEKKP